jgi:hypothetical protein
MFCLPGYPVYSRPRDEDLTVVPHNRQLLLDWGGHINVEFCGNSYAVMYLYKYLFKGNKKVSVDLEARSGLHPDDEISQHIRGRLLCSMDAVWRIFGYQTYPKSFPTCEEINVKTPAQLLFFESEQKYGDLSIYFARPQEEPFIELKYADFCRLWAHSHTLPARFRHLDVSVSHPDLSFYVLRRFVQTIYLFPRLTAESRLVRIGMISHSAGEIWYLRLLLLNFPAISFEHLRTVDGFTYLTFQAAAVARQIVSDDKEELICYEEAVGISTLHELGMLFCSVTL